MVPGPLWLLDQIASVSSRLEKESNLRKIKEQYPGWGERFFVWALDPRKMFYLTVDEEDAVRRWRDGHLDPVDQWIWFNSLDSTCTNISNRHITGRTAEALVDSLFRVAPSEDHVRWGARILNKDLRAGVQAATVNRVWPGLVWEFELALADTFDPEKHELAGEWLFEEKLDGNRVATLRGRALSRNGKEYTSFPQLVDPLTGLSEKFLIDGEMMTSSEFNASSGKLRRKGGYVAEDAVYNVFDIVPIDEWDSGDFRTPLLERKDMLLMHINRIAHPQIRIVPWERLKDPTAFEFYSMRDRFMAGGREGAMAKRAHEVYRPGRTDSVLKVKKFYPADVRIAGVTEHRKRRGWLGALIVELDGVQSKVGSGFTPEQREEFWRIRNELADTIVECEFQEKTPAGKLRFPTFKRRRPDKD